MALCASIKAVHYYRTVIKLTQNYLCIKRLYSIPASQSESSIQTDHGINISHITLQLKTGCCCKRWMIGRQSHTAIAGEERQIESVQWMGIIRRIDKGVFQCFW